MSNKALATNRTIELNDGNKIPALGLGSATPPEDHQRLIDAVKAAVRAGIRHIDTAWYYGSEPYIGQALKELFDNGEVQRKDLFITSKVWPALWDRAEQSLKQTLKDLGVDYVDLLYQHWPVCFKTDEDGLPKKPFDENGAIKFDEKGDYLETYKQILRLRDTTNHVKSIGVSNYTEKQLDRLIEEVGVLPVLNQIELHPRIPQKKLVEYFEAKGVKIEAFSPFGAQGAPLLKEPKVEELAQKYDVSPNEILTSYHIMSGRSVVPRTSTAERVNQLIHLAQLTKEEIAALDQIGIDEPKRFIQEDWGTDIGFEHWKKVPSWEEKK
ncbi:Aldo-keto reductase family 1 member [Wickerhamomyces ciferrii]|uniref:Aldo-keto reductase family 1 member n=1 Tax=Wickerhamomyces ciferrii (strain ATCC 14091 / BCRC 22168 / CBS 111 / JCM 3599 / NBRC 0793 / NRRL Y-1031 F-60-10) TaxID=1206466 RepID=K0KQV1_WICCF|nr:Aldo-keto reductase family 1 member [Wickerhamomyces ciferrii]CCH45476.1 Aldo-keto reductase family 1 member [Wickerhamomyces ciferrii]